MIKAFSLFTELFSFTFQIKICSLLSYVTLRGTTLVYLDVSVSSRFQYTMQNSLSVVNLYRKFIFLLNNNTVLLGIGAENQKKYNDKINNKNNSVL